MSDFSPTQLNTLSTLLTNISSGLALSLSEQINRDLELTLTGVQTVAIPDILAHSESVLYTVFSLSAPLSGENIFLFSEECGCLLTDLAMGNEGTEPPLTLTDAQVTRMNGVCAGFLRGLTTALNNLTNSSLEVESNSTAFGALSLPPVFAMESDAVQALFKITIPDLPDGEIQFLLTPDFVKEMAPEAEEGMDASGTTLSESDLEAMLSDLTGPEAAAGLGVPPPEIGNFTMASGTSNPFANFGPPPESTMPRGMELILDIPLDVTVELGRVRMLIKDVLELATGSIVELDRVAGEPVDLLVNGKLVAKGEVVVIEDNFGLRLTEIISPAERVANLGKGR